MKKVQIGVTLPEEFALHIKELAVSAGKSQSSFLLDLISKSLSYDDDWTRDLECVGCATIFSTTRSDKKYCCRKCKKRDEARQHWAKVRSDPDRMAQHRIKSRNSMRKHRVG
jgi:metal-responsive CopG/Arc/MetJ family transcriptional regulator